MIDDDHDMGYYPVPSDEQISQSPLVYLNVSLEPQRVPEQVWAPFADYGHNPLPQAFEEALRETIESHTGTTLPDGSIVVRLVDRPPRADDLFPTYFVDLSQIIEFFRETFPLEVISALIDMAVQSLVIGVRSRLPGKQLPEGGLSEQFSPAVLELLCVNYAMRDRSPEEPYTLKRVPFNTRFDSGYQYPVDDSYPMGWQITVEFQDESLEFTVDAHAKVIGLTITRDHESVPVLGVNLPDPESTRRQLAKLSSKPPQD
jgi:hypothetical protein